MYAYIDTVGAVTDDDNVASSVQVILFRLATNPNVQSRLFQDIAALDEIRNGLTLSCLPDTIFIR